MKPVALDGYGERIAVEALSHLGSKEVGNNGGHYVTRLLAFVGIHQPAPWCTAAAVNILHDAAYAMGAESTCPRVASGAKLWRWARANPHLCTLVLDQRDLQKGDVVIMGATLAKTARIRRGRLASGHTYIAGTTAVGPRGWHVTYEGNTNPQGGREGQGFYQRWRAFDDAKVVGAIRFQAHYIMGATYE